jgi:DNA-binding IclR family transcriptional regulator
MPGVTERTLAVLEYLATQMEGTPLAMIADELDIPRSACHRLLVDLKQCGYVRQLREHGDYVLTTKLVGLGLGFLATSGSSISRRPCSTGSPRSRANWCGSRSWTATG